MSCYRGKGAYWCSENSADCCDQEKGTGLHVDGESFGGWMRGLIELSLLFAIVDLLGMCCLHNGW